MFGLGPATKVFVGVEPTDMRKSFEGLYGLVRDTMGKDPLSGHLFLFANKTRTRLKILFWDGSGLWVCAKRLEKGRFSWPEAEAGASNVVLRQEELSALVAGLDLGQAQARRGWLRMAPVS